RSGRGQRGKRPQVVKLKKDLERGGNKMKAIKKEFIQKNGKLNYEVRNALNVSYFNENKIYPVHTSGSGRFTSNIDLSYRIENFLEAHSYKFKKGNDAPRGGKTGDFIKVSKTAMSFLKSAMELN